MASDAVSEPRMGKVLVEIRRQQRWFARMSRFAWAATFSGALPVHSTPCGLNPECSPLGARFFLGSHISKASNRKFSTPVITI
jgi:hypothetical protein